MTNQKPHNIVGEVTWVVHSHQGARSKQAYTLLIMLDPPNGCTPAGCTASRSYTWARTAGQCGVVPVYRYCKINGLYQRGMHRHSGRRKLPVEPSFLVLHVNESLVDE